MKLKFLLILGLAYAVQSCQPGSDNSSNNTKTSETEPLVLDAAQAKKIFELPTHCLEIEYPNKLGQILGSEKDLKGPKELRPVFYGCFDWHSAVHGYWSIVRLLKEFPQLDADHKIRAVLNKHITPEHVQQEIAFFNDENNLSFERTYGWAWLFQLQYELLNWNDADASRWAITLQPLADLLESRYISYLPKLVYPIRAGQHDNSAFSLNLSLDYARFVKHEKLEQVLIENGKRLFEKDVQYNLDYEPSGYDFLSPGLEQALFMSKVLEEKEFRSWLKDFMPQLFKPDFNLEPALIKDRTDGKLVHLDGLNFSRATCLNGLAKQLPELQHLRKIAHKHLEFSIHHIQNDDYMGSHWLGTFALYSLIHQ